MPKSKYADVRPESQYGLWIVLSEAPRPRGKERRWSCRCSRCGTIKTVLGFRLASGESQGCQRCMSTKHGMHKSRTYVSWWSMIRRCENAACDQFRDYGGRGIKVCRAWRESFESFLHDMGERPTAMTLERRDVNGDYEPSNCMWATPKQQSRNKRRNRLLTFAGETLCVAEWAERLGIPVFTLRSRLHQKWPVERALSQPVASRK